MADTDPVAGTPDELAAIRLRVQYLKDSPTPVPVLLTDMVAKDDAPRLLDAVGKALALATEARVAGSIPPADCTDTCFHDACDCSGDFRAVAWDLDPAKLREAIASALTGEENPNG